MDQQTQPLDKQELQFTLEQSKSTDVSWPVADQAKSKIDVNVENVRFWSTFDSGNLATVQFQQNTYLLTIAADCSGRIPKLINNKSNRNWFYFKTQSEISRQIQISITNLPTKYEKAWILDSDIFIKNKKQWSRLQCLYANNKLSFTINLEAKETLSIAFCYPWSYKKNQKYFEQLQQRFKCYYRKETLCYSIEGRKIDLITITNQNCESQETEYFSNDLFPLRQNSLPLKFNKPHILITCRVHPSETPASFILKGMMEHLLIDDSILDKYVLLIIPMLNPDGVYRGHQRLDALGYDQNRVYNRIYKRYKFPGPYAVQELVKNYQNIEYYFDLHAHTTLLNSFMFTNQHSDVQIQNQILQLPYLLSTQVEHFSFNLKSLISFNKEESKITGEIEGQMTDNFLQKQELTIHPDKIQQVQNKAKIITVPYQIHPSLTGVSKSDVYLISNILKCYTVEINYRSYYRDKQLMKFKLEDYLQFGSAILKTLQINDPSQLAAASKYINDLIQSL